LAGCRRAGTVFGSARRSWRTTHVVNQRRNEIDKTSVGCCGFHLILAGCEASTVLARRLRGGRRNQRRNEPDVNRGRWGCCGFILIWRCCGAALCLARRPWRTTVRGESPATKPNRSVGCCGSILILLAVARAPCLRGAFVADTVHVVNRRKRNR
jgi:hypothetical protein